MDKLFKRILIIRTGHLGDVLMITPLIRKLKKVFPGSSIDFITSDYAKVVLEANPHVDNIFIYRKNKRVIGKIKKFIFERSLARHQYDLCVVLEEHPQYHRFAQNVMGKKGLKIGLSKPSAAKVLDHTAEYKYHDQHVIEASLFLLRDFLNVPIDQDDYLMDFFIPDEVEKNLKVSLAEWNGKEGKYVVIHPGCSGKQFWRVWVPDNYNGVIRYLRDKGFRVFLTGTESERPVIDKIIKDLAFTDKEVEGFVGRHLNDVAFLIKHAAGVLSSDTGIMHIARAMQVPVVVLFGPSNPLFTGCIGRGKYVQIRNDFKCGPCDYFPEYNLQFKQICLDEQRPPACMRSITIEQVTDALNKILDHE